MKTVKNWLIFFFCGALVMQGLDAIFNSYPSKILIVAAVIGSVILLIYDIVEYAKEEEPKSLRPIVIAVIAVVCLIALAIIKFY